MILLKLAFFTAILCNSVQVCAQLVAQEVSKEPEPLNESQGEGLRDLGRTAEVGETRVGERQETDKPLAGIVPTARVQNRLSTRLQNRLRTRIDEFYDPTSGPVALAPSIMPEPDKVRETQPLR